MHPSVNVSSADSSQKHKRMKEQLQSTWCLYISIFKDISSIIKFSAHTVLIFMTIFLIDVICKL